MDTKSVKYVSGLKAPHNEMPVMNALSIRSRFGEDKTSGKAGPARF